MKKGAWWIVGIIVVIVLVIAASHGSKNNSGSSAIKSTVKIGLSLPLTGDLGFIGEADRNAFMMVRDEVASSTDLKNTYVFTVEDDAFDAQKGATSVTKLISVDGVQGLVSVGSTVGNVASPLAQAGKVVHFATGSDANMAQGEYNFTDWTMPQEEVNKLIQELIRRKITKVAIIGVNQQGYKAIENDFIAKVASTSIKVVGNETFNSGQKDFRTSITKLQKLNPEIYLIGSFDPETGLIAKQFKALGIKTPLTSVESFGLTADPSLFEGQWYVDAAVPSSDFTSKYEARFGKPAGPAAANVYDELHLLINGFESVSNPADTASVAAAVATTKDYTGALGHMTSDSEGVFRSEASVKIIKGGKPVLAQ
jgi:branched-chain amino acid transport system substrate-binding protein